MTSTPSEPQDPLDGPSALLDLQELETFMASFDSAPSSPHSLPAPPLSGSSLFGDATDQELAVAALEAGALPLASGAPPRHQDLLSPRHVLSTKLDAMGFSATAVQAAMADLQRPRGAPPPLDRDVEAKAPQKVDNVMNGLLDRLLSGDESPVGAAGVFGSHGEDSDAANLAELLQLSGAAAEDPRALPTETALFTPSLFARSPFTERGGRSGARKGAAERRELFSEGGGPGPKALFPHEEEPAAAPRPAHDRTALSDVKGMSYREFMLRLLRPESADLLDFLRQFLLGLLDPPAGQPAPATDSASLQRRLHGFYGSMGEAMARHVGWGCATPPVSEDGLLSARNWLERYVMSKIGHLCFAAVEDAEADARLLQRMQTLRCLTPEDLDVRPEVRNELNLGLAADELRRLNAAPTPGEKVACIVSCATRIFSALNLARSGEEGAPRPGADDFLPIFIYVVLRARVPRLQSNCNYIEAFHNPANLMSKSGYCFVNLCSAVAFIDDMDAKSINLEPELWKERLREAESAPDA